VEPNHYAGGFGEPSLSPVTSDDLCHGKLSVRPLLRGSDLKQFVRQHTGFAQRYAGDRCERDDSANFLI
jgi:hypothetical protein